MLINIDKFTDWLSRNHPLIFSMLMIVTICFIGAVVIPIIIIFPYVLILGPILTIYYTIHYYRKGDWK